MLANIFFMRFIMSYVKEDVMNVLPISNYSDTMGFKGGVSTRVLRKAILKTTPNIEKPVAVMAGTALAGLGVSAASNTDNFKIRNISDNEFQNKKYKIIRNEETFDSFCTVNDRRLNKWNVQLLDYMLKHPEEYKENREEIVEGIAGLYELNNKNSANVVLKMLKMPWLFKSESMQFAVDGVSYRSSDEKVANIKMKILDMLDKSDKDFTSMQMINLKFLLSYASTEDALKVAEKLIEKPQILKAHGISENAFEYFINDKKYAEIKLEIIDKLNSNPELLESEGFLDHAHGFINNVTDEITKEFALKVLDNPILFKSISFSKAITNILYEYPKSDHDNAQKIREIMNKILDAAIKRPELFENEKFSNELGALIFVQKNGDWIMGGEVPIEVGKRNLFLIEHGYYD